MDSFANMRVRTKLALSFGFLVLVLCVIVGTAVWRIESINTGITHILENRYAKVRLTEEITKGVNAQARYLRDAVIALQDSAEVRSLRNRTGAAREKSDHALAELSSLMTRPQEQGCCRASWRMATPTRRALRTSGG